MFDESIPSTAELRFYNNKTPHLSHQLIIPDIKTWQSFEVFQTISNSFNGPKLFVILDIITYIILMVLFNMY